MLELARELKSFLQEGGGYALAGIMFAAFIIVVPYLFRKLDDAQRTYEAKLEQKQLHFDNEVKTARLEMQRHLAQQTSREREARMRAENQLLALLKDASGMKQ